MAKLLPRKEKAPQQELTVFGSLMGPAARQLSAVKFGTDQAADCALAKLTLRAIPRYAPRSSSPVLKGDCGVGRYR